MRVLIQCGDNLENTRRVLALARLLRRSGHRPLVGVYTNAYAAPFQTMGIDTIALNAFRPRFLGLDPSRELGFQPDISDLLPIERSEAELNGGDIARSKEKNAIVHLVAGMRALDACKANGLVVWNGVTGYFANAFRCLKAERGLPGGFIERGIISDGIFFDREGTNGWSSTANGADLGTAAEREERRERHQEALSVHFPSLMRGAYLERAAKTRPKIVFVPLQVQRDSNILLNSRHIRTMRQLVIETIILRDRWFPDHEILVRPHPEEQPWEALNLPRTHGLRITSEGNLNEILAETQVTVTVNSTVGLEAALNGNLPIVCGESIYANEPFVFRNRPGSIVDPGPMLLELREAPERVYEQITDFMIALLDRNLVQPLKRTVSHPRKLLQEFDPVESAEPSMNASVLERARSIFGQLPGPVHCHVLTSDIRPINLDYRRLRQTLRSIDVDRMLSAILELDKPIVAKRGEWSTRRHLAIADPGIPSEVISDYTVVFTPNFGLHPKHRQRTGQPHDV